MATAWVGARDQISHTYGKRTMKLCCERRTSVLASYAKDSFLDKTHLLVSFLIIITYIKNGEYFFPINYF